MTKSFTETENGGIQFRKNTLQLNEQSSAKSFRKNRIL